MNLHRDKDAFKAILSDISRRAEIRSDIVEKDYYLTLLLWELSQRYGLNLSEMIALNPQIKNPNLIYTGQEVRVR